MKIFFILSNLIVEKSQNWDENLNCERMEKFSIFQPPAWAPVTHWGCLRMPYMALSRLSCRLRLWRQAFGLVGTLYKIWPKSLCNLHKTFFPKTIDIYPHIWYNIYVIKESGWPQEREEKTMDTIQMINLFNATKDSTMSITDCVIAVVIGIVVGIAIPGIIDLLNR